MKPIHWRPEDKFKPGVAQIVPWKKPKKIRRFPKEPFKAATILSHLQVLNAKKTHIFARGTSVALLVVES
jgi:hypothetical protein